MSLLVGLKNSQEHRGILQFFAFNRQVTFFAESDAIVYLKAKFREICERLYVMSFYIAGAFFVAHLTNIVIALKYGVAPFLIFPSVHPNITFITSFATLPTWILRTTEAAFETLRNLAACFFRKWYAITGMIFSLGPFLSYLTQVLALLLCKMFAHIPSIYLLPVLALGNTVIIKKSGDANPRGTELFSDNIYTQLFIKIKAAECIFVRLYGMLRSTALAPRNIILVHPIINCLGRFNVHNFSNFRSGQLFIYVQSLEFNLVKHLCSFRAVL